MRDDGSGGKRATCGGGRAREEARRRDAARRRGDSTGGGEARGNEPTPSRRARAWLGGLVALGLLAACGAPRGAELDDSADRAARVSGADASPDPDSRTTELSTTADALARIDFDETELRRILRHSPLPPPPPDPTNRVADDPAAARLGQRLFFDRRLSKNAERSCADCHDYERGWADGLSLGEGVTQLNRNTMSLWNVAYNRWFFWDGRADSLWAQALGPLENPLEHAFTRLGVAHVIAGDDALRTEYEALFGPLPPLEEEARFPPVGRPVPKGEGHGHVEAPPPPDAPSRGLMPRRGHVHAPGQGFYHPHQRAWDSMHPLDQQAIDELFANVGKAIAAYERRLVSRRAPFDVFVEGLREGDEGKLAALSAAARRGLKLFVGRGRCHLCHSGPTFSDLEFHDVGVPDLEPEMPLDEGRVLGLERVLADPFNGRGRWSDDPDGEARAKLDYLPTHGHNRAEFKTPSLRNVATSAPYHHQGQFATLEEVVEFYSTREGVRTDPPLTETLLQPLHLDEREKADLVAFLRSLTDVSIDAVLTRRR